MVGQHAPLPHPERYPGLRRRTLEQAHIMRENGMVKASRLLACDNQGVNRHHTVPQMLLRAFADEGSHLLMAPRGGGRPIPAMVKDAAVECGFYQISVPEELSDRFHAEHVENLLSRIESAATPILSNMVSGRFPLALDDRFNLALFVALQLTRGPAFAEDWTTVAHLAAKRQASRVSLEQVEEWQAARGRRLSRTAMRRFWEDVRRFEGVSVTPSTTSRVMLMLRLAIEDVLPRILARRWQLLQFDKPGLLLSDHPCAMWGRPDRDLEVQPLGVATADALWMPLDRRHALSLTRTGPEGIRRATATRMRQINTVVAGGAHRWIFHHPEDSPLAGLDLPARTAFVDEIVDLGFSGVSLTATHRLVKRPVSE